MMKGRERGTVRETDNERERINARGGEGRGEKPDRLTDKEGEGVVEKRAVIGAMCHSLSLPSHHHSPIQLTRFASFITLSVPPSVSLQ